MLKACPYCGELFRGPLQSHKRRCAELQDRTVYNPGVIRTGATPTVRRVYVGPDHYSKEYGYRLRQAVRRGWLPKSVLGD